ncbi:MAG TPA: hypothetical protein VMD08_10545 [Candidatus Baltobacteraceae bacterium]|nr:hypothetical protein [Candidatus Baltobacteraceae bacterium]
MPDTWRTARSPRSTPELIVELQARATAFTLAAIAVLKDDGTEFVFAIDDDALDRLNTLVRAGGHPIGLVAAQIGCSTVEYHAETFIEYQHNPRALAYLQSLRTPFLTLLRTHVDRMPDNPRLN